MKPESSRRPVLVTGATGYIGSRLVPRLLDVGVRVRAMARSDKKIYGRPWAGHPNLEIVEADVLDLYQLQKAVAGCSAIYYLIHSMASEGQNFAAMDRLAAENMVNAASLAGVSQIIYLGGLGEPGGALSHHLLSRHEVAEVLQQGPVPVTVLRAAMIIGSGSASFEILRYLVDRLPVMITPRWIDTPCQPIAVRNVLGYLIGCLGNEKTFGRSFDIGQNEVVTYRRLMELYARQAGLPKRWIVSVPVLTPRLSSYWIHLVTPVPGSLARPLAEGLKNPVVCREQDIRDIVPQNLLGAEEAIHLALTRLRQNAVESSWMDAGEIPPAEWSIPGDPQWAGGTLYQDGWQIASDGRPEDFWDAIGRIGGDSGWYYADWLWNLRGILDRLVGGVGLRRGRRNDRDLAVGDAVDFWRVVHVSPPQHLLLVAEMKLPGEATLEFTLSAKRPGEIDLAVVARFLPTGLWGIIYWFFVSPWHAFVFRGMLRRIALRSGKKLLSGPKRISFSTKR